MRASKFINDFATSGRYHFDTGEFANAANLTDVAARAALRRVRVTGRIATPYRGFHVIVPPEHRRMGCLPPDQFIPQLMTHLSLGYYVGLLSAAEYHGAAHQRPQVYQVMVRRNRPPLRCGGYTIEFTAKQNITATPSLQFNTPRGYVTVSTPEATALDLVGYFRHAGGMDNVATVLCELAERINGNDLVEAAQFVPVSWSQRLGYILTSVGAAEVAGPLARYVVDHAALVIPLSRSHPLTNATVDRRWKLLLNAAIEPDL